MCSSARHSLAQVSSGFSIIEVCVVVAIISILAAIAVPSFQSTLDRQRVSTVASDLYASVTYARAEAIRRGGRVDLAPQDPSDWAKGWKITVPPLAAAPSNTPSKTIYTRDPAPKGLTIQVTFVPAGTSTSLFYDGTGKIKIDSGVTGRSATWLLTMNSHVRQLTINQLGRPFLCDPSDPVKCPL